MSVRPVRQPVVDSDVALQRFFLNAGAPTSGIAGTGTYAGVAPKGAILIDTTTPDLYIQAGDLTTATWKKVTRAA